jgi:uncharacterized protein YlxP (DUF503 family)
MVVASQTWQLSLPGCASLKEKRSVVRSMKDRLRTRLHLSVAETALQDVLSRAELSVALVATDRAFAGEVLDKADRMVQENGRALVVAAHRDYH